MIDESKNNVLIIDDCAMMLNSVSNMLSKDYNVFCAISAKKAKEIIYQKKPDLILLDYEMPGCNGKEAFEMIRQYPGMEQTPIVFLTGVANREHVKELLMLRPAGYILKPPEPEKLLQVLQENIKS